jgi:transposase
MDKVAVGIDVSKNTLDAVSVQGEVSRHASFKNTEAGYAQIEKWLDRYEVSSIHVCLEATGQYGEGVAEYLYQHRYAISVVNPVRIKAYSESRLRRNKTDKLDAALIADFCMQQNPPLWKPIPPNLRTLQSLMRRLDDLQGILQQERNRLKAGELPASVQEDLQAHIAYLEQRIREIERQIETHVEQAPELKATQQLLTSIPGIGEKTAHLLMGEIPFLREYLHVNQLVAFCGLNPRLRRSGISINGKPRLSKVGNSRIRKGLYFPAIVAMKHNPILKTFADRLLKAGKSKMCVIGAVMRKLMHLVFGILKSGQPFDPNYRQNALANP